MLVQAERTVQAVLGSVGISVMGVRGVDGALEEGEERGEGRRVM